MAQVSVKQQTATTLAVSGLGTLASATYAASDVMTHVTNGPLDVLIFPVVATTNTLPSSGSNLQVVVFAQASYDGTPTYTTGPASGTSAANEADLHYVGSIPLNTASTNHSKVFSLAAAFGGVLPHSSRLVFKNDCGVALTSATVRVAEVIGTIV
jgi:hypothetical protein